MKKVICSILLVITIFLCNVCLAANITFSDLPSNHWAYNAVNKMVMYDVINGYPDGTFRPSGTITRAEFSKIMVKALKLNERNTEIEFLDIADDYWGKEYIEKASKYLTGYKLGDGYVFYPDELAVREDMAVALVIAQGLQNNNCDLSILDKFTDKNEISSNLQRYMAIAVENGIMQGYEDNTIRPQGTITRAEATQLIVNVVDKDYIEKNYKSILDSKISFAMEYHELTNNGLNISVNNLTLNDYIRNNGQFDGEVKISYAVANLDNNNDKEMVIYLKEYDGMYIVLKNIDGTIYGYEYPERAMSSLKDGGIFTGSSGASNQTVSKFDFEFDGRIYPEEIIASMDNGIYKIGNIQVTEQEYNEFFNENVDKKQDILFTYYNKINKVVLEETEDITLKIGNITLDSNTTNSINSNDKLTITATHPRGIDKIIYAYDNDAEEYIYLANSKNVYFTIIIPEKYRDGKTHNLCICIHTKDGLYSTDWKKFSFKYDVLYGDVNGNGKLDTDGSDCNLLLAYLKGENVEINKKNADMYTDGKIDWIDWILEDAYGFGRTSTNHHKCSKGTYKIEYSKYNKHEHTIYFKCDCGEFSFTDEISHEFENGKCIYCGQENQIDISLIVNGGNELTPNTNECFIINEPNVGIRVSSGTELNKILYAYDNETEEYTYLANSVNASFTITIPEKYRDGQPHNLLVCAGAKDGTYSEWESFCFKYKIDKKDENAPEVEFYVNGIKCNESDACIISRDNPIKILGKCTDGIKEIRYAFDNEKEEIVTFNGKAEEHIFIEIPEKYKDGKVHAVMAFARSNIGKSSLEWKIQFFKYQMECGDLNDDGQVDFMDANILQRYISGDSNYQNINQTAADTYKDGVIDDRDVYVIMQHDAGVSKYSKLPCSTNNDELNIGYVVDCYVEKYEGEERKIVEITNSQYDQKASIYIVKEGNFIVGTTVVYSVNNKDEVTLLMQR